MYKNRRKTLSSQPKQDSEYENFKINEFVNKNQNRESLSSLDELNSSDYTNSQRMLFNTLLNNPDKRAKVFELLTKEGLVRTNENVAINGQLGKKNNRVKVLAQECSSPVNNGQNKFKFESPSSRLRRLQLEELERREQGLKTPRPDNSDDESLEPLPTDQILKGVVAFCDVRSGDEDRSGLIKRAMESMGAEVVDRLKSRRVTHVVYRDGSYETFQRARILKAKLVSVLWIEACRKKGRRVNEAKYPALGMNVPDFDLTDVCGRLQFDDNDSDSVSIVSLTSDSSASIQSGVIDSSQNSNDLNKYSYINVTADISPRRSDDLGNQVHNSLELKKVQHIRSPDSVLISRKRQSSVLDDDEDNLALHLTSDESKSRNSGFDNKTNVDESRTKSRISALDNKTVDESKTKNRISGLDNKTVDESKTKSRISGLDNKIVDESRTKSRISGLDNKTIDESKTKSRISLRFTSNDSKICNSAFNNKTVDVSKTKSCITVIDNKTVDESNVTKRRKNSLRNQSSVLLPDESVNDSKIRRSRRSTSMQVDKKSKNESLTNQKITDFMKRISNEGNDQSSSKDLDEIFVEPSTSTRSEESLRLHISTDESKGSCSTTSNAPNVNPIENTTVEPTKPKRRRLYNPDDYDLENMEIRWSQERQSQQLDLPNTTRKYGVQLVAEFSKLLPEVPKNLTAKAKKYLKNKSTSSKNSSSDLSSAEKQKDAASKSSSDLSSTEKPKGSIQNIENRRKSLRTNVGSSKTVNRRKSINIIDSESSTEKLKEPTKKVTERRKSANATNQKSKTPVEKKITNKKEESESSDVFYSLTGVKNLEENNEEPQTRRQSIRKKLYTAPENEKRPQIQTPRRSIRISMIKTPSIQNNVDDTSKSVKRTQPKTKTPKGTQPKTKTVIETPKGTPPKTKTVIETSKTPKGTLPKTKTQLPNTVPKSQKVLKGVISQKDKETEDDDESIASNSSRYVDKLIAKEVCERRSTFEFEIPHTENKLKPNKADNKGVEKYGTIVSTRLHRPQTEAFIAIVRRLGKFRRHEDEVTKYTTHLVAGDTSRTINLLRAIARGCWIVRHEWILRSAEAGKWLPEKDYELTEFSPAVQYSRMERSVFGKNYKMNILQGKRIWVTASSSPRKSDLKELIELIGGVVATAPRRADIILGESMPPPAPVCVAEKWLLECISNYKFVPYEPYLLHGPTAN